MVLVSEKKREGCRQALPARSAPLWVKIAAFLACQLVALLLVELVLYCAGLGEEEIFKFDKQLGFRHMTNKRITWRTEGYAQSYLNQDGLREPDVIPAKPANFYRIALLGDSMVEGLQVPLPETFGQILQKRLTPIEGKKVQFVNFATSGYSTVQEYLQLKNQVLKFHPDLVLLCYNSRDIFENWTPPDEVVTNVRPFALHLPGQKLVVNNAPVLMWMSRPRAKFLMQIDWIREHSRIYGLLSAIELDWSQHNPWYRAFVSWTNHPKKFAKEWPATLATLLKPTSKPAFDIKFFEDAPKPKRINAASPATDPHAKYNATAPSLGNKATSSIETQAVVVRQLATAPAAPVEEQIAPDLSSATHAAASPAAASPASKAPSAVAPADGRKTYRDLITRTLGSLLQEMKNDCAQHNCQFAVIAIPVRAALCPIAGMETTFCDLDYQAERQIVSGVCREHHIAYHDAERDAEDVPSAQKPGLFYAVHLTRAGQKFIADDTQAFIDELIKERLRPVPLTSR